MARRQKNEFGCLESLRLGHGCLSLRFQWSDDVRGCDRGAGRQRWHLRGEIAVCCVGLLSFAPL